MTDYIITIVASLLLACGTLVIGVQNPIHSILFLVLVFFNGSIILMMLGVDFFALIFLIVYVGAIVILFLFMVMMLKIKHINVSQKLLDFFPYASFIIGIFLIEILTYNKFLGLSTIKDNFITLFSLNWNDTVFSIGNSAGNVENLGQVLYTTYVLPFLEAGFILFLSMVGAIVIALDPDNKNKMVVKKQQDPINQMVRQSENAIYFSLPNTLNYTKNKNKLYQTNFIKLWQNHILHTKPNIELKRKKILY
jgi:NADH-quinone oxidoreductase subunit J